MDDSLITFLSELRSGLSGFPESETREAVAYYEEYISDALEEGEKAENILSRLDSPGKIVTVIMAETSIRKAQNRPGLKNYSKVLKYSRVLVTRPFSILLFFLFVIVTYGMALLLFLGSFASAAAACILLPGSVYEALNIPAKFTAEIIGTIGAGLFSAALCLLLAYGLFKLCALFIRLSTNLVSRMLNKPGNQYPNAGQNSSFSGNSPAKAMKSKRISLICSIALAAGLVLSLSTGLPFKLFMIFNSMEPASVKTLEWAYNKADVNKISVTTAHSHIRLEEGNSDKIRISYEQPDWMEPEISCKNGQLTFNEVSNGRLPLFPLVSIHENRTDVVLTLPQGFKPESLKLESRGGFIYLATGDFNAEVETYTGNIYIEKRAATDAGINAGTSTGIIQANGKDIGTKTTDGLRYEADSAIFEPSADGAKTIRIQTSRGSIFMD